MNIEGYQLILAVGAQVLAVWEMQRRGRAEAERKLEERFAKINGQFDEVDKVQATYTDLRGRTDEQGRQLAKLEGMAEATHLQMTGLLVTIAEMRTEMRLFDKIRAIYGHRADDKT